MNQSDIPLLTSFLATEFELDADQLTDAINKFLETKKIPHSPGELVILSDYTPNSAALFGDTKKHLNLIKSLSAEGISIRFNKSLHYGPGWVFSAKHVESIGEKLGDVPHKIIARDDISAPAAPKKVVPAKTAKPKVAPTKPATKVGKIPGKSTFPPTK